MRLFCDCFATDLDLFYAQGESALLTEEPRNAFIQAKKTLQLYVLSKEDLEVVFGEFPDVERIVKEPLEQRKKDRIKAEEKAAAATWLAEVPLFSGQAKDGEFLATLTKQLEVRSVAAGAVVIEKGRIGDEMFFIVRGEADVLTSLDERPFASLKEGSFFGESALVSYYSDLSIASMYINPNQPSINAHS